MWLPELLLDVLHSLQESVRQFELCWQVTVAGSLRSTVTMSRPVLETRKVSGDVLLRTQTQDQRWRWTTWWRLINKSVTELTQSTVIQSDLNFLLFKQETQKLIALLLSWFLTQTVHHMPILKSKCKLLYVSIFMLPTAFQDKNELVFNPVFESFSIFSQTNFV